MDKDLTVLFSDIRSFTTLSESMSPQELVNHLNTYLTAMTDIILDYGGYLDKYVGDEVMCFWGAPLPQADHAVPRLQVRPAPDGEAQGPQRPMARARSGSTSGSASIRAS